MNYQIKKVFDVQDFDVPHSEKLLAFKQLELIEGNDNYIPWCINDWNANKEYYKSTNSVEAIDFINNQLLKMCPDLNPDEQILINIWW